MLTLLTLFLKFQLSMTTVFALGFSMAMRDFEVEGGEFQLEVDGLDAQGELRLVPADEPAPFQPEEKEDE